MIMEETGKIFKKEKEMKKGEACSSAGALLWAWWVPAARGQRGRKGCPLLELAHCSQRAPLSPAHTITSELELRVSSLPKMRGTGGSAALGTVTWLPPERATQLPALCSGGLGSLLQVSCCWGSVLFSGCLGERKSWRRSTPRAAVLLLWGWRRMQRGILHSFKKP